MASRRDSPFFPLYVDAFVSDEKLNECSATANGVYIRILCLMHKSEDYGKVRFNRTSGDLADDIADKLGRHLPYSRDEIVRGVKELIESRVLYIDGDFLCQKRMIKDASISDKRSAIGKLGMARRWAGKPQQEEIQTIFQNEEVQEQAQKPKYTAREFKRDIISLKISAQTAADWMANRKSKRLPPTITAFEEVKRELEKGVEAGYSPELQLHTAAVNGWGGYKYSWFLREVTNGNSNNPTGSVGSDNAQEARLARNYDEDM